MKTHPDLFPDAHPIAVRPHTRPRIDAWFGFVLLGLVTTLVGACGARVGTGNTGSETHWLAPCESNEECGGEACYCGLCTARCDEASECTHVGAPAGLCVAQADLRDDSACTSDAPTKLCARSADLTPSSSVVTLASTAPDATSDSDAGGLDADGLDAAATSAASAVDALPSQPTSSVTAPPIATGPAPNLSLICDGSDDVRFVMQVAGGGQVAPSTAFLTAYGWSFFVIDGHCHFWISYRPGVMGTGTVGDLSLLEAYESAHYGRLADCQASSPVADGSTTLLWDPATTISGSGCGDADESSPYTVADTLFFALRSFTQLSEGPLRILLTPGSSIPELQAWPLADEPLSLISTTPITDVSARDINAGTLLSPGDHARLLRSTRGDTGETDGIAFGFPDVDPRHTFTAYLRDELPPHILAALQFAASAEFRAQGGPPQGDVCSANTDCDSTSLICAVPAAPSDTPSECTTCIGPDDPSYACDESADCCGGLTCCVDCGALSGTCIKEPDACAVCHANDAAWDAVGKRCVTSCSDAEGPCFYTDCPELCAPDDCGTCLNEGECWDATCLWLDLDEPRCVDPVEDTPCAFDATDASLPGVTVHLEADRCDFVQGQGGEFRYHVEMTEPLTFTMPASVGCGTCFDINAAQTWTQFMIDGQGDLYCETCDVGCCPPLEETEVTLEPIAFDGAVYWPGLNWSGPSDTGEYPHGVFTTSMHTPRLTVSLPGLGEVTAELPMDITPPHN